MRIEPGGPPAINALTCVSFSPAAFPGPQVSDMNGVTTFGEPLVVGPPVPAGAAAGAPLRPVMGTSGLELNDPPVPLGPVDPFAVPAVPRTAPDSPLRGSVFASAEQPTSVK